MFRDLQESVCARAWVWAPRPCSFSALSYQSRFSCSSSISAAAHGGSIKSIAAWRVKRLGLTKMPTSRLWVGRVAWAAAFFYALVLIGTSAFNFYSSVIIFLNMPRSVAVITSSTGAGITASPAEWNAHAWKLATDPDPSARNPIEAVRLAEQTVASDPKNGDYVKTLGVARYRAGDLAGSIEALNRSVDGQGLNGSAGFFLAMAQARLGRHAEAQVWYRSADEWMRANQPNDAALRRFRGEAAAVLDVADDKPAEKPPGPPRARSRRKQGRKRSPERWESLEFEAEHRGSPQWQSAG